jgi:hypothetical protein
VRLDEGIEVLQAILCDPDGNVCAFGDADNREAQWALDLLKEESFNLENTIRELKEEIEDLKRDLYEHRKYEN